MPEQIYSLCFMCSVRCPIRVTVQNGQVKWIEGNPNVPGMEGSLCARGAAGTALLNDDQRVQAPMIRVGPRGSGEWKQVDWGTALTYVAKKLSGIVSEHGGRSVVLAERTNLATPVSKTFMAALGSPNHCTHDALCKGSVNTACRSLFGINDAQMGIDYKNAKHMILYGRNLFEAISVKEVRNAMTALESGMRLTYIDPRVTKTATKAHRYWMIRPGTDLALNYALINTVIREDLYDREFVSRWVQGFDELAAFVAPYTPEWAERETGIPAREMVDLAREAAQAAPSVVFHFGYRGAHHENEIDFRRSILILNSLFGSIEAKGGYFFKKGPGEAGGKPARKLNEQEGLPKPSEIRFDKVGTPDFPLPDKAHGVAQVLPHAILNEDPYPIKALIAFRFDPLMSMPDTGLMKKALDKLDLVVAIDIQYSDIAWNADIILPEHVYLERTDCVQQANGQKPQMFLRSQAVRPRCDTREGAMILKGLAERMGLGRYFPYESMEDLVRWQLEPTGFTLEDFAAKGFVSYCKDPIWWDRADGLRLKTPSGKIEFVSSLMEDAGFPSFPEYPAMPHPPEGQFRLTTGRCAVHTHVSTQNNPYLAELFPENTLWINRSRAQDLGVEDGSMVSVRSSRGEGRIKAFVTDFIHPEAVFLLHGFGHEASRAKRCAGKGVSDALLMESRMDRVGGSPGLHETFVSVSP